MEYEKMDMLHRIYELEKERLELQRRAEENDLAYRQAKYDLRTSQVNQTSYEGLSFSSLKDRLTGKYEEKLQNLRRQTTAEESRLLQVRQEKERIQQKQKNQDAARQQMPAWETIRDWIGEDTAGIARWAQMEIDICAGQLLELVEITEEELSKAQQLNRGDTLGAIISLEEQQKILGAHIDSAQRCKVLLIRVQEARNVQNAEFEIPPYFCNPAGFIANATRFTQFDRYNDALSQIRSVKANIKKLRYQEN